MTQVHKRFTDDQLKSLFRAYDEVQIDRGQIEEVLGIGKTRFFALWKLFRKDPSCFSVSYHRGSPRRLTQGEEDMIQAFLLEERAMVEDPVLPISSFNYSATQDRLREHGVKVPLPTIIDRAKAIGCHRPHPKKKTHAREVIITAVGALVQHDASLHGWSPYAKSKWTLISSFDDYSRKLLFADFFEHETTRIFPLPKWPGHIKVCGGWSGLSGRQKARSRCDRSSIMGTKPRSATSWPGSWRCGSRWTCNAGWMSARWRSPGRT